VAAGSKETQKREDALKQNAINDEHRSEQKSQLQHTRNGRNVEKKLM